MKKKKQTEGSSITFLDKGWCDENDPIFTEGITAFSLRRQQPHRAEEKLEEAYEASGSPLTHQAEDERQSNGENN